MTAPVAGMGLTPKALELLRYIGTCVESRGVAPSYREAADALGLESVSGIHRMMQQLEARGHIRRLPHRARAVEVVQPVHAVTLPPAAEAWLRIASSRAGLEPAAYIAKLVEAQLRSGSASL
ncbi:LexA family protein [Methylobacterium sp. JK268]